MPPTGTPTWACSCSTGRTLIASDDPHATALTFALSSFRHACDVCGWDPELASSAEGKPPPVS